MKSIIDTIITLLFLLFSLNIGLEFLHNEIKRATIIKLHKGLPPLAPFTQRMTGWDPSQMSGWDESKAPWDE